MSRKKAIPAVPVVVPSEPLLVSLKDAAKFLGVQVYSIRQLTRRGVLPYRQIGNKWLVNYAALKAFANGRAA
jgi:excisionase family DNA binding protein